MRPNLVLIYESGAVGAVPERLPVIIGDPSLVTGLAHGVRHGRRLPVAAAERADRGRVPRRGADRPLRQHQHDRRRHRTSIPTCGCPGSGGAAEIAIHARRTVVISRLSRRAFPETVDFITSPGHRCARTHAPRARHAGRGPGQGRDRQGHSRGRPGDGRAGADGPLSGRPRRTRCAPGWAGRSAPGPLSRPSTRPPSGSSASCGTCSIPIVSTSRADPSMTATAAAPATDHPTLPRALGLRDMVLFNVVAVVSLRWFATAAAAGPSSITLWVLAALFFFVPQGLAVSDLAARYPDEGGIYAWTKRAFGEGHGFLCGWCYWVNNILYYPNLLMSTAVVGTYVIGRGWHGARRRAGVRPAGDARGALARGRCSTSWACVPAAGCRTWARWAPTSRASSSSGSASMPRSPGRRPRRWTPRAPARSSPSRSELNLWASIAFAFAGLELCAVMGGEVKDPAAHAAPLDPDLGAAHRLHLHRRHGVGAVAGADRRGEHRLGVPAGAARRSAATSAAAPPGSRRSRRRCTWWATSAASARGSPGPARVAFVIGLDRYFPPAFGKVHPKWQTPYVAILTQAVLATVFLLVSVLGQGHDGGAGVSRDPRHDAARLLHPLHLPLRLLSGRAAQGARAGRVAPSWRGRPAALVIGLAGPGVFTLFAMGIATVPPEHDRGRAVPAQGHRAAPAFFVVLGGLIYWAAGGRLWRERKDQRGRRPPGQFGGPCGGVATETSRRSVMAALLAVASLSARPPRRSARPCCSRSRSATPTTTARCSSPRSPADPARRPGRPMGPSWSTRCRARSGASASDSTEARQLTDGPGYDYQPDWSPDGRRIVYASYRDDAIELRLLDLVDRRVHASSSPNGAVNLEPRWSPDGGRHRVHVHACTRAAGTCSRPTSRADGRAERIERITEDKESGLPRYYYNTVDHVLSPTWSPDGTRADRRLQSRPRLGLGQASGGCRRAPGGTAREIRDEETTWKARPDWSRDGRRVVYSSYLGRQWNQLWLMTADGANPLQLTYGDFDATAPRWSPDGRRIAYVSNERRQHVALDRRGARRTRGTSIRAERRVYRRRSARSGWRSAAGRPSPRGSRSRGRTAGASRPTTPGGTRTTASIARERRFEYGYFHTIGRDALTLPAGRYDVEVTRGPEFRVGTPHGRDPRRPRHRAPRSRCRPLERPRRPAAGTAPTSTCT